MVKTPQDVGTKSGGNLIYLFFKIPILSLLAMIIISAVQSSTWTLVTLLAMIALSAI